LIEFFFSYNKIYASGRGTNSLPGLVGVFPLGVMRATIAWSMLANTKNIIERVEGIA
jgi:hypothetical protein